MPQHSKACECEKSHVAVVAAAAAEFRVPNQLKMAHMVVPTRTFEQRL
jgi:hypothetical protein